jgi:hypothetical protein
MAARVHRPLKVVSFNTNDITALYILYINIYQSYI